MKTNLSIILLGTLLALNSFADNSTCPKLGGQFYCLSQNGSREPTLDVLTIKQWIENDEPSVTNYSFAYRSLAGLMSTVQADAVGINDGTGWITKCRNNRLVSITPDFTAMSELYIDRSDLVRAYNQNEVQRCTFKSR